MLELRLFGALEVHSRSGQARALSARASLMLAYLALNHGRAVPSTEIVDAVFADTRAEDPHDLVKKAASGIRRALGEDAYRLSSPAPRVLTLDLDGARVDWLQFQEAVRRSESDSLEHAVALHTRPLLEAETAYWAIEEQSSALRLRQGALEALFRRRLDAGDMDGAGRSLMQMLRFELPYVSIKQELWRELLRLLAFRQDYGQMVLHYRRLGSFLERTAGRLPDPETQALYQSIPRSATVRMASADGRRRRTALPDSARIPGLPCALIGREQDRCRLHAALQSSRLVTLVGIGGVGKTHCALAIGHEIEPEFKDGVAFVDLTPCSSGAVAATIAACLGIKEEPAVGPQEALCRYLGTKQLALILDNCEHVIEEVATVVADSLRDCSVVRLLLTSREALRVAGERVVELRPLALPDRSRRRRPSPPLELTAATVIESPAVRLFVERASASTSAFELTDENAGIVADLCELVDGIPLGIEIVATQAAALPLERVRRALRGSALDTQHANRGIAARHRTLHAALEWSHGALSPPERALFRRLSVFIGGWSLDAAEAVCSNALLPTDLVAPTQASLVAKSLVVREPEGERALPYHLLETIRTYADGMAQASEEVGEIVRAHCQYYADLVTTLGDPSNVRAFFAEVDRCRPNLYAAMQRSLECPALLTAGHRICLGLHSYWAHRALRREARDWHRRFLERGNSILSPAAVAGSMLRIADYCVDLGEGDAAEAERCRQEAFRIYREIGDRKGESDVYFSIGMRQSDRRLYAESYASFEKAYEYYGSSDRHQMMGFLQIMMGGCLTNQGRYAEAKSLELRALDLARRHQMPSLEALALMFLGFNARDQEMLDLAERFFTECADLYETIDSDWGAVTARSSLADIKGRNGDPSGARLLLRRCLEDASEFTNLREVVSTLAFAARLAHGQEHWHASLRLALALSALAPEYPDVLAAHRDEMTAAIGEARTRLTSAEADEAVQWAGAAGMGPLVDFALAYLA